MVLINKKEYVVNSNEFQQLFIQEYCNLNILKELGLYERIIGLLTELNNCYNFSNLICIDSTHGGFIPIECSKVFSNVLMYNNIDSDFSSHKTNIEQNISKHLIENVKFLEFDISLLYNPLSILYIETENSLSTKVKDYIEKNKPIILLSPFINIANDIFVNDIDYNVYCLSNSDVKVCIPITECEKFNEHFRYYLKDDSLLEYDNLINLCIMVKNGGKQFEEMLTKNLHVIDRWTILDTGSTDETIDIINRVLVGKKQGNLYQEPFINFKDSRNRLLDLAGTSCKYTLMIDDTYVIEGNLREFLNTVRGDQFSDSFSLFIKSDDTEYGSNRLLKSDRNLRYLFKIHEVIDPKNNNNVIIPITRAYIFDGRFDYMEKRTMERKALDLKLLYDELQEDPSNSRTHYYLAQTYNLLEDYENTFKWFNLRVEHPNEGFIQEKVDAAFEAARVANFKLNKPWSECEKLYLKAYELDQSRPESLYFIGIHYYLENDFISAYKHFKKAFEIGYPSHCQYSLKPTLSFHFLPKFLARTCYGQNDYKLGETSAAFFIANNKSNADDYDEMVSWYNIYKNLNKYDRTKVQYKLQSPISNKPIFVFVADGGFNQWSGKNIITTGVGGSETYIIEMARYIQQSGQFDVVVFCNCSENEVFEGVEYKHLDEYFKYINENHVHTCIVSRYSEYLPVAYKGQVQNVYLVVHDLTPSGIVIPIDPKLKNVFCLTEWHVQYMKERFPALSSYLVPFYYGIDTNKFLNTTNTPKVPYKFIYSSFPNRGLLPLLQMWPAIFEKQPLASLHIYSDVNGTWVNQVAPDQMIEIRRLLSEQTHMNIFYHGWVDKQTLANAWLSADIWFYPCIFMETFCLTALEAAMTKTFAVTNDLAALQNTVGDRGVVIKGDPMTKEWQSQAIEQLFYYMDTKNNDKKVDFININYQWAHKLTWKNQANRLLSDYIPQASGSLMENITLPKNNLIKNDLVDKYSLPNFSTNTFKTDNLKEYHIKHICNEVYNIINSDLLPLINSFNELLEGSLFNKHLENKTSNSSSDKQYNICNILRSHPVKTVLEIGFNAGFSTLLMLLTDPFIKITCIDICEHRYTIPCYEWLAQRFPGRIEFLKGDTEQVLPELVKCGRKYDMIHIDGGHGIQTVFNDIQNSLKLSKPNTVIIMDDYDFPLIKFVWDLFISYYKLEKYPSLKEPHDQDVRIVPEI